MDRLWVAKLTRTQKSNGGWDLIFSIPRSDWYQKRSSLSITVSSDRSCGNAGTIHGDAAVGIREGRMGVVLRYLYWWGITFFVSPQVWRKKEWMEGEERKRTLAVQRQSRMLLLFGLRRNISKLCSLYSISDQSILPLARPSQTLLPTRSHTFEYPWLTTWFRHNLQPKFENPQTHILSSSHVLSQVKFLHSNKQDHQTPF